MHAPLTRDTLLNRADEATATARRLEGELSAAIDAACTQCRRMEHWRTLQSGLAVAIAEGSGTHWFNIQNRLALGPLGRRNSGVRETDPFEDICHSRNRGLFSCRFARNVVARSGEFGGRDLHGWNAAGGKEVR